MPNDELIEAVEWVMVPKSALLWLNGEGPDDEGNWFGQTISPSAKPFWWRNVFQRLIATTRSAFTYEQGIAAGLEMAAAHLATISDAMDEKAEAIRQKGGAFDMATTEEEDAAVMGHDFAQAAFAIRALADQHKPAEEPMP